MLQLRLGLSSQGLQVLEAAILEAWGIRVRDGEAERSYVVQMLVLGGGIDGSEAGCQIAGYASSDPEGILAGIDIGRQSSINICNGTWCLAGHGGGGRSTCCSDLFGLAWAMKWSNRWKVPRQGD